MDDPAGYSSTYLTKLADINQVEPGSLELTDSGRLSIVSGGLNHVGSSTPEDLDISSRGESFKLTTRNYPHRITENQGDISLNVDDDGTSVSDRIVQLYTTIGKTLSSPQVLSGTMNLAALFTRKAADLPHFYKNRVMWISFLLVLFCIAESMSFLVIFNNHVEAVLYILIPLLGPLLFFVIVFLLWVLLPRCTRTLQLRAKLQSMEPFLDLCEISNSDFEELFDEEDYGVCDYKVVGSAGDGFGFFASQGSNKHPLETKSVLTQDIDLNIFMNTVPIEHEHIRAVPGAKGFVWLVLTEQQKDNISDPVIRKSLFNSPGTNEYFLSAAGISREASVFFRSNEAGDQAQIEEHFPALTLKTTAVGPNGVQTYEVDYAFVFRYPHWPQEASEWITRQRNGLDAGTVHNISSRGCYLVHKPCGQDMFPHNHEFDWRYTFASAEADLFHYHRDKKALKLAFVILKFLIKMGTKKKGMMETLSSGVIWTIICYLKNDPSELPVLRTYHLKTVFLWMAEEETELDIYTIKGNKDLGKVFMKLLKRYKKCVQEKNLPNYFMRTIISLELPFHSPDRVELESDRNMLSGSRYQDDDFRKAEKLLSKFQSQPTYLISMNFERQFINKKALVSILVGLLIATFILGLFKDLLEPFRDYSANSLSDDTVNSKYFTQRYATYLQSLM